MALPRLKPWSLGTILDAYLPKSGGTMTGDIVLKGDPTSALNPVTKQYVDGIAANLGKRGRVRAATTANITIATALNNGDSLDGVTLATGDLVLVKDQSSAAENGIYIVGASPARAAEFDTYDEHPGSLIAVQEGTSNADTVWLCTSNKGGTLGSTAIVWSQFTAGASYPDPRTLNKSSGTSIDFANVEAVQLNYASSATISSFTNAVVNKVYAIRNTGTASVTIDRSNAHLNGSANIVLDTNDVVLVIGRTSTFIQQAAPKSDNG